MRELAQIPVIPHTMHDMLDMCKITKNAIFFAALYSQSELH
eukprot:UN23677